MKSKLTRNLKMSYKENMGLTQWIINFVSNSMIYGYRFIDYDKYL